MNRKTTSKGQQEVNPEMTMLVYREMSYPAREVQGKDGNYLVSVERLEQELLDGIRFGRRNRLLLFGRRDPPVDGR